jgi:hypothetical protein
MPTDQGNPVAVLRREQRLLLEREGVCLSVIAQDALAELERRRGREKRLEALVRGLLDVVTQPGVPLDLPSLVEAARKEIENG